MLVIIALLPTQKIVFLILISAFEVTDCDFW